MAIFLALASAFIFGGADYAGGIATRKNQATFPIVYVSQLIGLTTALMIAPFFGIQHVKVVDLGWGAAAGFVGCIGLLFFYRALAVGIMSIVSPVTAVVAAVIPVAVGFARGERPSVMAIVGIVLGIAALSLFGGGDHSGEGGSSQGFNGAVLRSLLPAIIAGIGFGAFFSLIAQSNRHAGLWPLVAARVTSFVVLTVIALAGRQRVRIAAEARNTMVLAGAGDVSANALFLLASRRGDLAIVGVVASLYPASTLLLARWLLHERLGRMHLVALGFATLAVVLIAGG